METVCRMCLKLVTSSCSEPVEDGTKEVLNVLLIHVDLSLSENPLICLRCKRRIGEFCDFKVMCIETEDLLQPYLRKKTNAKVDLKSVYLDSLTQEETVYGSEILRICRLCMKSKHCEYYSLSTEVLDIFEIEETFLDKFLPEVSLSATKSPIICQSCLRLLAGFAKFVISWSKIEQKIIGYCNMARISSKGRINLGKIARFIKNVTPGLIPSDEQEDEHFLQCIDKAKANHPTVKHEISKNTAVEKVEEAAEHLWTDEQKRKGKKKLGVKNQEDTKPTLTAKIDDHSAKHTKNRASKKRTVGGNQIQRERRKKPTQVHSGKPSSLLDPLQRQAIVSVEIPMNLKDTQAKPGQNSTPEPQIEVRRSTSTGKKTYFCPKCDLSSLNKQIVQKHFFRKHQLICCADCPFTTVSKNTLKTHITKFHRLFRCNFCPRTYNTFQGRRIHMNTQHTKITMFQCKQCDFESKYRANMNKHAQVHSGRIATYRCNSCSYSSNFSGNLRRHVLVHLDPSEVETFKCYQCDFETKRKVDLAHHIKYIHLEVTELLQCSKCSFKTKYKTSLALHSGKHDNIVYQCEQCDYRTVNKESWKKHCRGHENS